VSETNPFTDAAFTGRLQKLVPMLGSEQPGEADAARRKIGEHLAHFRLSFTDLANHLRDAAPRPAPSFSQQAREASLERQLAIARQAKEEAAHEAEAALHRVRVLEIELQQVTFEIARQLNSQARVRLAAAIACIIAAACLLIVVLPRSGAVRQPTVIVMHNAGAGGSSASVPTGASAAASPGASIGGQPTGPDDLGVARRPGDLIGRAAVQDLAIRLAPNDQAATRAFLNYGEAVVIQSQVHIGQQTWLLIRSITGTGWVRSGDVLR
jgi:hypothetical protein